MAESVTEIFPYDIRPIQVDIIEGVGDCLGRGHHIVLEAGTGSGKTVSALVPIVKFALAKKKRILYLTRTNSQQRQVILEFRKISEKISNLPRSGEKREPARKDVLGEILDELNDPEKGDEIDSLDWVPEMICVGMQGRSNMCPVTSEDPEFMTGTPEELSKMCAERKKHTSNRMSGRPTGGKECPYYSAFMLDEGKEARDWAVENKPTAEELLEFCLGRSICPYEVTKALMPEALLVTAPYIYFFYPFIRRRLLEWMDCSLSDIIVVVDEAHNLANFIRDISSISVSKNTLRMAMAELEKWGDHEVANGVFISTFLRKCQNAIDNLAGEYLIDEDGVVPPSSFREEMMLLLHTNSARLDAIASEIMHHGATIQDQKKARGKLPRSYIHTVARFYRVWNELEFDSYTPLILAGRNEGDFSLEAFAMDPSVMTSVLSECQSSVHMSGTLAPLEEYRDSMGLPEDSILKRLPPPFPLSNRLVLYDTELTTNYEKLMKDPSIIDGYRGRISRILESTEGRNTALFFPSFRLMSSVLGSQELEDGGRLPHTLSTGRELYLEERGSKGQDLMDLVEEFKMSSGGVLVSVLGGRLSEGMDFPGRSLEQVIIVGIPYPKPTAKQRALASYYDIKFGKGWEYTVHAPASRRILQALGRMIRSEEDRGVGHILDKRAIHFAEEIRDLEPEGENLARSRDFFG